MSTTKAEKLSLAFTPEHAAAIRQAVETGGYATNSEVVREAMRLWTARQARRKARDEALGRLWDEGLVSGPGEELTSEEVLARVQQRAKAKA